MVMANNRSIGGPGFTKGNKKVNVEAKLIEKDLQKQLAEQKKHKTKIGKTPSPSEKTMKSIPLSSAKNS